MAELIFYVLAVLAVVSGVGVVACRNPLFSLLSLLGAFFCLAGIYLLAGFQFLAATQLLVYAGAIMVLFLFVIMLLNLGDEAQYADRPEGLGKPRVAVAGVVAALLVTVGTLSVGTHAVAAAEPGADAVQAAPTFETTEGLDDLNAIGELLFSRYVLPFEASSLLLLATMIAVILLAKRQRGSDDAAGKAWPWKKGSEQ